MTRTYWDRHWQRWTWLTWLLLPLSGLFCFLVTCRRWGYRLKILSSVRVHVPVVVVGNISVGGTGKTPLALWLVHMLARQGLRPGIVMRGYGGSAGDESVRVMRDADPRAVGDEALLMARRSEVPVVIARDRVLGARALHTAGCDVVVCDDGLQHYRLARDLEIAVVDGQRGVGNGLCLPAGPLRETKRRLTRVSACVINGDAASVRADLNAPRPWRMQIQALHFVRIGDNAIFPLDRFAGSEARALAGIGNPARFFAQLAALHVRATTHAFPDHYRYRGDEPVFAVSTPILMTEKDAVKCASFARENMYYLAVAAVLEDGFAEFILQHLRECHGQKIT